MAKFQVPDSINPTTARRHLRSSIALARRLEDHTSLSARRQPLTLVGYGLLVRNRRLAGAVLKLGEEWAYEGRILVRSMVEIHINYAWIRSRNTRSRAIRFIQFEPLEQLQILKDLGPLFGPDHFEGAVRRLRKERSSTRHLFRYRDRRHKLRWARHWAHPKTSFYARWLEVQKDSDDPSDRFLYGWYRWASIVVHGGMASLSQVLRFSGVGLRERPQPLDEAGTHYAGAFALLMATLNAFGEDAQALEKLEPDVGRLMNATRRYAAPLP